MKYCKSSIIDPTQSGENSKNTIDFLGSENTICNKLKIHTFKGTLTALIWFGDYIIKDTKGKLYPC